MTSAKYCSGDQEEQIGTEKGNWEDRTNYINSGICITSIVCELGL